MTATTEPPATEVREALPADLDTVVELHLRALAAHYRDRAPRTAPDGPAARRRWREWWAHERAAQRTTVLCAVREGAVVGVVAHRLEGEAPPLHAELTQLQIDPGHWSTGVATALLTTCLASWREAGVATAGLQVAWHNRRARAFYGRRGWEPDQHRRPAPDATHLHMTLRLRAQEGSAGPRRSG